MALFMARDLGVHDSHQLAFWVGLAPAALGLSLAVASPIWGVAADRFGRKPMLVRALFGASLIVGLISLARSPLHVIALESGFGLLAGAGQLSIALAAQEMSRKRVGFGIGVVQSASAVGQSIGPVIGSLAGIVFGLRTAFVFGGAIVLAGVIPVMALVRETRVKHREKREFTVVETIRRAAPGSLGAIGVLIVAQALSWSSFTATGPLVALRILKLAPATAATSTGITFAAASVATALAAVSYSWVASRLGYKRLAIAAAIFSAAAIITLAMAPSITVTIAAFTGVGLARGVLAPAIPSMIGLEAPPRVLATVIGVNASAQSIGIAVGPLLAGSIAALFNAPVALIFAATLAISLATLLAIGAREPAA
jgi:MFS family permease